MRVGFANPEERPLTAAALVRVRMERRILEVDRYRSKER